MKRIQCRIANVACFIGIIIYVFTCAPNAHAGNLCTGGNATLECLAKNFQKMYSTDSKQFWKILHASGKKALSCKSVEETAKFMSLVRIENISSEFNEFLSETIENICIKKSQCFFEAAITMPQNEQRKLIELLLEATFVAQTDITKAFKKHRAFPKYKRFSDIYLNRAEAKKKR
jgi:hypothetical protein